MTTTFQAISPIDNQLLDGQFQVADKQLIDKTIQQAVIAFDSYRKKSKEDIAQFLEQAATEIEKLGDALIERGHLETALPHGRLTGERGRTCNQLRLFAKVVREGSWVDARIDTANADIRQMLQPLGPVAVFGASNFPLAFSTAGGDTASALAAGCPVIVKGHPAHPGTTELVAKAILTAAEKTGMPAGTFSLLQGNTNEVGKHIVMHPAIKAVGFTGSYRGGMAIRDYANSRQEPIPVFAEMGSTNPVFILPQAMKERGDKIAEGLATSINLGVGQFCTNPGLAFLQKNEDSAMFCEILSEKIANTPATTMLTSGIQKAYAIGIDRLSEIKDMAQIASGHTGNTPNLAVSKVFQTSIDNFFNHSTLEEEVFGPSSVLINYNDKAEMLKAANSLKGHLTATVHGTEQDLLDNKDLLDILEKKVGRLIINGFPTGVEVCHAMVHGGPFPATTASQTTSVGTNAIKRFARPICYQGFPDSLLPIALQKANPLGVWRLENGTFTR